MAEERTITATKLRRDLGSVLDAVLCGTTLRIERNGRPLAVLVPPARYDELTKETQVEHFTAWLVSDKHALDQGCMDVTVLEDELVGEDPEREGSWSTKTNAVAAFSAVTTVDAENGDPADAQEEARELLDDAGWMTVGKWQGTATGYTITVERTGS